MTEVLLPLRRRFVTNCQVWKRSGGRSRLNSRVRSVPCYESLGICAQFERLGSPALPWVLVLWANVQIKLYWPDVIGWVTQSMPRCHFGWSGRRRYYRVPSLAQLLSSSALQGYRRRDRGLREPGPIMAVSFPEVVYISRSIGIKCARG